MGKVPSIIDVWAMIESLCTGIYNYSVDWISGTPYSLYTPVSLMVARHPRVVSILLNSQGVCLLM